MPRPNTIPAAAAPVVTKEKPPVFLTYQGLELTTHPVLPPETRERAAEFGAVMIDNIASMPVSDWTKESWAESLVVNWAYATRGRNSYVTNKETELKDRATGDVNRDADRENTSPNDDTAYIAENIEVGKLEGHFAFLIFSGAHERFQQVFGKVPNLNRRTDTKAKGPQALAAAALQWGSRKG
jgi:hypothetical protein